MRFAAKPPMSYSEPHKMGSIQDKLTNAIWQASLSEVEALLTTGASPNAPDSKGWTPLMQAAEGSNLEILQRLLGAGAKVNGRGIENCTCLHIAVDYAVDGAIQTNGALGAEPTAIIEFLLSNGADIFARDDNGKTPLDLAHEYQSAKIIQLLEEYIGA